MKDNLYAGVSSAYSQLVNATAFTNTCPILCFTRGERESYERKKILYILSHFISIYLAVLFYSLTKLLFNFVELTKSSGLKKSSFHPNCIQVFINPHLIFMSFLLDKLSHNFHAT